MERDAYKEKQDLCVQHIWEISILVKAILDQMEIAKDNLMELIVEQRDV